MFIISTLAHLQQVTMENGIPPELSGIIESEFLSLMSAYKTAEADDNFSLEDHSIRICFLEDEREFFALTVSHASPPLLTPHMFNKPEYTETLSCNQTEVIKLCYLLDNECFLFLYVPLSESMAAWIREHIEG